VLCWRAQNRPLVVQRQALMCPERCRSCMGALGSCLLQTSLPLTWQLAPCSRQSEQYQLHILICVPAMAACARWSDWHSYLACHALHYLWLPAEFKAPHQMCCSFCEGLQVKLPA